MPAPDRLETLLAQSEVTGIDFVAVDPAQTTLDVFFLRDPATLDTPLVGDVQPSQLRIHSSAAGESLPEVPVAAVAWAVVDGRDVLRITTALPGGFSRYRLRLDDPRIDPYYNDIDFSFKAACPSDLDCQPPPHLCPPEPAVDFPVDYQARDFWSFRRALLDFAAERYPDWKDRLEADAAVMLAEVMSALGDELSYHQDRVGREAYLETASQRRSLRRHARLVDYEVHDGLGAVTWLDVTVDPAAGAAAIPAGTAVREAGERVHYEVGRGLQDRGASFAVDAALNEIAPHLWDEDDTCLPVGSTALHLDGHHPALTFDDFSDPDAPGKWLLLRTTPVDPAVPARAWPVRVTAIEAVRDPVFGRDITRLAWAREQATPFELDLTALVVRGNLVPATAGRTVRARFRIGPRQADADPPPAVEREGPGGSVAFLFSLPDTDAAGLVRLGASPAGARPELLLHEVTPAGDAFVEGDEWEWRRSLLGVHSSQPADRHFTLDDGAWRRVVGYQRVGREIVHEDYATGAGVAIRFGDGEFGAVPVEGTWFQATYRLGGGRRSNLAAGTLTHFDAAALPFVLEVTNPVAGAGGLDPEHPDEVRRLAPDAFRAVTYRAVRPEDYAEAAERLPWVERAGAAFRWTGSWLTAFVTPDPRDAVSVSAAQERDLFHQLDRFRQAGREAFGRPPRYADLDLAITVCVAPNAFRGEVKARVLEALLGRKGVRPRPGFFSPGNFTFGTPLERSRLEAAVQAVEGVRAVEGIEIRRRGWFDWRPFSELTFRAGDREIVRVENDALHPERGSIRLIMEGGA